MLRKDASEMGAVEADDRCRALRRPEHADAVLRKAPPKQLACVGVYAAVTRVEKEAKAVAPPGSHDVPITEVQPEQLGVVRLRETNGLPRCSPAPRAGLARLSGVGQAAPIAHRRSRQGKTSRHLAVVEACPHQRQCLFSYRDLMHEHMFVLSPDG